ncbi:hypothetical protein ASD42_23240 [Nocardia sp. Root136]|nr:hypothetical protein ASD42_23240 [Nocardia sp. Root136]
MKAGAWVSRWANSSGPGSAERAVRWRVRVVRVLALRWAARAFPKAARELGWMARSVVRALRKWVRALRWAAWALRLWERALRWAVRAAR